MTHVDNVTRANKKNRVGKSRLETELNRINREQISDMRMHNNTKQRFKNKYAKLDVFDENKGSEASDVVMYETHNPGFCYRRNGDCRLPQSNITSSSVDMEDLHQLLFTEGEVDTDKVLCLYLLSAHKTETLTPPPQSQRKSFLAREQSPLERLVDRSKKRSFENTLKDILPLYVIDAKLIGYKEGMKDQRLTGKIIVNVKILQMVNSVKTALEISNPEIMSRFMTAANSLDLIRSIMTKPKMINFYRSLHGQNIISSCESFYLESPQKLNIVMLDIGVVPLENLTRAIRKNVLLIPNTNTWNQAKVSTSKNDIDLKTIYENADEDSLSPKLSILSSMGSLSDSIEECTMDCKSVENDPVQMTSIPKIFKNHQQGFSKIDIPDDMPSPASTKYDRMDFNKLANLLTKKVRIESKKDFFKMLEDTPFITTPPVSQEPSGESLPSHRTTLKQTTCEACLQKWRQPLPTPKTSKIKKIAMPVLKETSYFSSRSAQKISEMIDDEVKRFDLYDKSWKPDTSPLSNRMYKKLAKGNYTDNTSIEIIDLNDLELAKIRQEIRENETQKKLAKFMNKPM